MVHAEVKASATLQQITSSSFLDFNSSNSEFPRGIETSWSKLVVVIDVNKTIYQKKIVINWLRKQPMHAFSLNDGESINLHKKLKVQKSNNIIVGGNSDLSYLMSK